MKAREGARFSEELEKLVQRLPPNATATMAMGLLARTLNEKHPLLLKWLDPVNAAITLLPSLKVRDGRGAKQCRRRRYR